MSNIMDVWLHAHNMIRSARQIITKNLHPLGLSSAEGNVLLHLLTQGLEMGQEQLVLLHNSQIYHGKQISIILK